MQKSNAKIIYLTAGAAGMYCGSCMHDNALAKALASEGWDIQLVPTYTPIRTDEDDVSVDHVLFGGVNVFLQQKIPLFRYLPSLLVRLLDNPRFIRRVTANAGDTDPKTLGSLAVSMLKGTHGNQRKEVFRMCDWLQREKPDLLIFTNILIGGCIEQIKQQLDVPVLVTLQGDDVFLDSLDEPFRSNCLELIKQIATRVDGFIVHSEFFRQYMGEYFGIATDKIHVTPLGIDTSDFAAMPDQRQPHRDPPSRTIGYMARLAPEKGLHHLVEAFIKLKQRDDLDDVKLKIAGWLGPQNQAYAQAQWDRLEQAGLKTEFEYIGSIDRAEKLKLLAEIDVLSVPTEFKEPKGLYVLEALAAGVPVVQPAHGAFPETIQQSSGGILFEAGNTDELTNALAMLLADSQLRSHHGEAGRKYVHQHRNARSMAASTAKIIEAHLR